MLRQYTLLLGLCAFSMSCSQQGGTAINEGLADPQKSTVCSIKLSEPIAYAGNVDPQATVFTMKNDGGWCWYLRATDIGNRTFGVKMHVVRQPQHGEVAIAVLERATRIAYKPFTEFEGLDEFSVNNDMFNVERPYKVVVNK